MQFRTARLIPHIEKALKAPEDLLNIVAAYECCHKLAPEEFPSVKDFQSLIRKQSEPQQEAK